LPAESRRRTSGRVRILLVVSVLAVSGFAVSCGGGGSDYSDEAVAGFMNRCGGILGAETCDCLLDNFSEANVSPEELQLILSNLRAPIGEKQELQDDLVKKLTVASEPCMHDPFGEPETQSE
jgi:hypothetical protein